MTTKKLPPHVAWCCSRCASTYTVATKDPDFKLLKKALPCFRRGKAGEVCTGEMRMRRLSYGRPIRAMSLYQAVSGFGLEEERKCSPAAVKKLLVGSKIIGISVAPAAANKNRTLLTTITLEGGKTVHLAPSTQGVTVYKVTSNG